MKELTTEQKAQRYDEAIERAKKWYNAPNINKIPTYGNRVIEEIFPELKDANIIKGCGIEFPYFGASYPDARCIDGYLWDMDSGEADEDGVSYSYGGNGYPCPVCNTKEWLEHVMENEEFETKENALVYVEQLKKHYL